MSKRTWVNLAVFERKPDAAKLEIFLRHQGFEARSYNDWLMRVFLFLRPPRATWRVQVRKENFKPALNFITNNASAAPVLQGVIRCPECASFDVQYPQMTRKFLTPTLMLHLGIIFRIVGHEAYCEHCHHIWHLFTEPHAAQPEPAAVHK